MALGDGFLQSGLVDIGAAADIDEISTFLHGRKARGVIDMYVSGVSGQARSDDIRFRQVFN